MNYSNFNKILTVKRSSYIRMMGDFIDEYNTCTTILCDISKKFENSQLQLNCQYPNLTLYADKEYSQSTRTLKIGGKITCPSRTVSISSPTENTTSFTEESVVVLDNIDAYRGIISQTIVPKTTYFLESSWRYRLDVRDVKYGDLLATHIPSFRQASVDKIPLKYPIVNKIEFSYTSDFTGKKVATKRYCIENGILLTGNHASVNTSLVIGDNIAIESNNITVSSESSVHGENVWIDNQSPLEETSIISPEYAKKTFARRDLSNVSTLMLKRSGIVLDDNDAIAKEEVLGMMMDKLSISSETIPFSTKVFSSSSKHMISDLDAANILVKFVEGLYASILLKTRETSRSQIDDLIQDKINEIKNTFVIMSDCQEMNLKGEKLGCILTDADMRALKKKRLIEKWLLKQLLERSLLECSGKAEYWIRQ